MICSIVFQFSYVSLLCLEISIKSSSFQITQPSERRCRSEGIKAKIVFSTSIYHAVYVSPVKKSTVLLRKNHTALIIKSNCEKDFGGNNV